MITEKPMTFVSFCVDIGRGQLPQTSTIKRDFNLYKSGLMDNLRTQLPMVIYSSIKDIELPKHRNDDNLQYNYFDVDTLEKEFPDFSKYSEYYPKTHKDELSTLMFYYAPLVVLKLKKIVDVIEENPFNSDMFFWADCYFTRGILSTDFLYDNNSYQNMCKNVYEKIGDKFLLFNHTTRPFGFFWGGTKKAIMNVYEKYFDIFFETLPTTILHEELIFKKIYELNPELFHYMDITDYGQNYKIAVSEFITKK